MFSLGRRFLGAGNLGDLGERLVILEEMFLGETGHAFNLLGVLARGREEVLRLAELDEKIKGGELDYEAALLELALTADLR